ncbi:MAG: type II toxin-antitoxin system Phd/YefM family antitoxin [Dysgonomonas sp.]|nr:type II toxin-antitoxin system Phd/YefM family antitoxin [Dysgonomonas sp.]
MKIVTARQFRSNQKAVLDMVDEGEQIVVKRSNKAYLIVPITESDRIFSNPQMEQRIEESIAQIEKGEVTKINKDDISTFLGI